jgi:hypothetical protein
MASQTNPEGSDLDRVARLIAELDGEESLLTGLDPSPSSAPSPEIVLALAAIREQRALLEEELAEVWAKTCSKC